MILAPWREPLQRAIHLSRSIPYSRYIQLATVSKEGKPANRTVVFRGFLPNTNIIQIVTDTRSQKFSHLQHQSWAEICWYFSKTRQQFRFFGKVILVTAEYEDSKLIKARQTSWQALSDSGKEQFFWPTPGDLLTSNQPNPKINLKDINPPANFCLLLFNSEKVDFLALKGNPQKRYLYFLNSNNTWLTQQINP